MASADVTESLICSICLNICEDPIKLRCGHNFCRECIQYLLDTLEGSGDCTCPECRAECREHPVLPRKQLLMEDNGIFCTECTFSPLPAVISCLYCGASLCDNHLRVHSKSEEHVLTKLNLTCSTHKKAFTYYCSEDAACICVTCLLSEEHQGHQVEPLTDTSDEKKEKLYVLETLVKNKKAAEEKVEDLQNYLRGAQEHASGVTEKVVALFRDTRRELDALEHKILNDISNQVEEARASVCDRLHELEIQITELSREIRDMEALCTMTEPLPVLQRWESLGHDIGDAPNQAWSDVDVGLISATLHTALSDIVTRAKRGFYVQQTPDIVLNLNTASNDILITTDLKSASGSQFKPNCPKLPERFQYNQVLSTRSFPSGRHFLEVETCHTGNWRLGMSYPSIARKGYHSLIGHSNKSWGLCRYLNQYFVIHDRKFIPVPHKPSSQRLGIFLDYEAGYLGFYELCDPIRHLYTYSAKFIEALYFILGVYTGWVRIRN
ncbi:E3 ubiquitin-protein ligase TRIM39-like [Bufo bufo]|uniref:E3 ubiquitin-protein ligase TRIM39-like n=1 Tax=Bufo bufo TaxID=8384 RepID=UPI001ABEB96B|nr:E3 ubiquitin-protein ligase TRIM39-like [Bufo bufo]